MRAGAGPVGADFIADIDTVLNKEIHHVGSSGARGHGTGLPALSPLVELPCNRRTSPASSNIPNLLQGQAGANMQQFHPAAFLACRLAVGVKVAKTIVFHDDFEGHGFTAFSQDGGFGGIFWILHSHRQGRLQPGNAPARFTHRARQPTANRTFKLVVENAGSPPIRVGRAARTHDKHNGDRAMGGDFASATSQFRRSKHQFFRRLVVGPHVGCANFGRNPVGVLGEVDFEVGDSKRHAIGIMYHNVVGDILAAHVDRWCAGGCLKGQRRRAEN